MASALNAPTAPSALHHRPITHKAPVAVPAVPGGTFAPGTKVQVGDHRVVIEKYLSEGGFAHVYLVRLPKPINGEDGAVLKRVAVPDKDSLAEMRTEVETMKKLKGHRHIVTYIDSHASQLKGGGYEVFLLMEYCAGGGLIDFMNTRLQNRLTEPEILKIFSDVAEGVACMHYLKPPLLHRDLKVENVLISVSGSTRRYKLCDFGSTAPPRPAAKTAAEGRLIEDDVQKHTTLQYRSPEMIDVYRKQSIDEKSDIWALGVLLYKLCYYTTPFEELGQMAILNASFKFPGYPTFSDRIKKLIASMLRESPQLRPNIYQIMRETCLMRGTDIPIRDIYAGRSRSEARANQQLPSPEPTMASPPMAGAFRAPSAQTQQHIPEIVPMRRGRPTKASSEHTAAKPSPSPLRGAASDPFAALDTTQASAGPAPSADELSNRFPTLDQFALLHDSGSKFEFDHTSPVNTSLPKDITQRVTEVLADEAFALPPQQKLTPSTLVKPASTISKSETLSVERSLDRRRDLPQQSPLLHQPTPHRAVMVSTGTMTSPSPPPSFVKPSTLSSSSIHRLPNSSEHRSSSQPRASDTSKFRTSSLRPDPLGPKRPGLLDHRSKSQTATITVPRSPASSRPSLEGQRPSSLDLDNTLSRSKSVNTRPRPSSVYVESNLDYLRERESVSSKGHPDGSLLESVRAASAATGVFGEAQEDVKIVSDVDFLRAMEEDEALKKKDKRSSSGSKHVKRASMPSISLSGTKTLLAGRFGDAFRRFETNTSNSQPRTPSPSPDRDRRGLTPIAGSEATEGRSDDGNVNEETEEVPPEVRRELERRRLSQEERRVATAGAEYRKRMAEREENGRERAGVGGEVNRAASIQNKVRSLLDESKRSSSSKSAEGYGRSTDSERASQPRRFEEQRPSSHGPINAPRKALPDTVAVAPGVRMTVATDLTVDKTRRPDNAAAPSALIQRTQQRPTAPPKPKSLRTGGQSELPQSSSVDPLVQNTKPSQLDREARSRNGDDWETNFSKRYPSLSGLEMVETEIDKGGPVPLRVKEV
ncbi:MAG: hypothetical protein M1830_008263 [Pleopsidium flavum]|nr:MAG: hypothetical protein M1830_008263 [Pleopsidium flavum]